MNYYDKTTGEWSLNLYQENNEGEKLGQTGTVAVCSDDNVYFVSKETPWLVEVGLEDFLKKSALPDGALTGQAYGFALIDGKHGVLTTSEGAYSVSLDPLEPGRRLLRGARFGRRRRREGRACFPHRFGRRGGCREGLRRLDPRLL